MFSVASKNTNINPTRLANNVAYEEAHRWIGCRLILHKALLTFKPGTRCVVMCVVDFGDGPLLWVVTDDEQQNEVDQLELSCISDYFRRQKTESLIQSVSEVPFVHC